MAGGAPKTEANHGLAEEARDFAIDVDRWSETVERLAEYARTGESVDAEEALRRFEDAVASRVRRKA